jgi:hypothetical protein
MGHRCISLLFRASVRFNHDKSLGTHAITGGHCTPVGQGASSGADSKLKQQTGCKTLLRQGPVAAGGTLSPVEMAEADRPTRTDSKRWSGSTMVLTRSRTESGKIPLSMCVQIMLPGVPHHSLRIYDHHNRDSGGASTYEYPGADMRN